MKSFTSSKKTRNCIASTTSNAQSFGSRRAKAPKWKNSTFDTRRNSTRNARPWGSCKKTRNGCTIDQANPSRLRKGAIPKRIGDITTLFYIAHDEYSISGISLSWRRWVLVIFPWEVLDNHGVGSLIAKTSSCLHEVQVSIVSVVAEKVALHLQVHLL